jgi:Protein of unknown function (DUF3303)
MQSGGDSLLPGLRFQEQFGGIAKDARYNRRAFAVSGRLPPGNTEREGEPMKFMVTWAFKQGALREAAQRFLAGEAAPVEGTTLLGRWHGSDLSCGFAPYESNNPVAIYEARPSGRTFWTCGM